MILYIALCQAAEIVFGVGYAQVVNDPFYTSRGATARAEVRPLDWLGVGVDGGVYPYRGFDGWNALAKQLVSDHSVVPDVSPMKYTLGAVATVAPLRGTLGTWSSRVGLVAGVGAVRTDDDLEALQAEGEPAFEETELQFHPYGQLGLFGEVRHDVIGGRLRLERMMYTEVVGSELEEQKNPVWLSLEVAFWPRTGRR